jgi:hypothetical protein
VTPVCKKSAETPSYRIVLTNSSGVLHCSIARTLASATCAGFTLTFFADATGVGAEERTGTNTRLGDPWSLPDCLTCSQHTLTESEGTPGGLAGCTHQSDSRHTSLVCTDCPAPTCRLVCAKGRLFSTTVAVHARGERRAVRHVGSVASQQKLPHTTIVLTNSSGVLHCSIARTLASATCSGFTLTFFARRDRGGGGRTHGHKQPSRRSLVAFRLFDLFTTHTHQRGLRVDSLDAHTNPTPDIPRECAQTAPPRRVSLCVPKDACSARPSMCMLRLLHRRTSSWADSTSDWPLPPAQLPLSELPPGPRRASCSTRLPPTTFCPLPLARKLAPSSKACAADLYTTSPSPLPSLPPVERLRPTDPYDPAPLPTPDEAWRGRFRRRADKAKQRRSRPASAPLRSTRKPRMQAHSFYWFGVCLYVTLGLQLWNRFGL